MSRVTLDLPEPMARGGHYAELHGTYFRSLSAIPLIAIALAIRDSSDVCCAADGRWLIADGYTSPREAAICYLL